MTQIADRDNAFFIDDNRPSTGGHGGAGAGMKNDLFGEDGKR
jgi:hypothetical protein